MKSTKRSSGRYPARDAPLGSWPIAGAVCVGLVLVSFAAYSTLAARDVMFGDGAELTLAAATNGVAHPPGYPLWIVLAHLFTRIPFGSIPFRVNLTACAYHAGTVGLVYLSAFCLTRRYLPSLAAALLLATTPLFVTWSLQAEVFSLNDIIVAAVIFLSLLWLADKQRWWLIAPLAALFGFGLANQQTLILLAPVPVWVALYRRKDIPRTRHTIAVAAASGLLFALGFCLPYLHTWFASQHDLAWGFGQARTVPELIALISRRAYGTTSLVGAELSGGTLWARLSVMLGAVGAIALVGTVGAVVMVRGSRKAEAGVLALIVAFAIVGFCAIANVNASVDYARILFLRFALMPLVAMAPFSACAIDALDRVLSYRTFPLPSAIAVAVVLIAGVPSLLSHSLAAMDDARTLMRDEFAALPQGAIGFVKGDTIATTAPYFQIVERWRPDVLLIYTDLLTGDWYVNELRRHINVPPSLNGITVFDLITANPKRRFFGLGDPDVQGKINVSGSPYVAFTRGLASWIAPRGTFFPLQRLYSEEVHLQMAPNYGMLKARDERFNGFTLDARSYYANGFYNAGLDAARLHRFEDARVWLEHALFEVPDSPLIADALAALPKE